MNGNVSEIFCGLNLIAIPSCEVVIADSGEVASGVSFLPCEDLPGTPSHAFDISNGVIPLEFVAREIESVGSYLTFDLPVNVESNVSSSANVSMGNVGFVNIPISIMSNTYLKAYLSCPLNSSVML